MICCLHVLANPGVCWEYPFFSHASESTQILCLLSGTKIGFFYRWRHFFHWKQPSLASSRLFLGEMMADNGGQPLTSHPWTSWDSRLWLRWCWYHLFCVLQVRCFLFFPSHSKLYTVSVSHLLSLMKVSLSLWTEWFFSSWLCFRLSPTLWVFSGLFMLLTPWAHSRIFNPEDIVRTGIIFCHEMSEWHVLFNEQAHFILTEEECKTVSDYSLFHSIYPFFRFFLCKW